MNISYIYPEKNGQDTCINIPDGNSRDDCIVFTQWDLKWSRKITIALPSGISTTFSPPKVIVHSKAHSSTVLVLDLEFITVKFNEIWLLTYENKKWKSKKIYISDVQNVKVLPQKGNAIYSNGVNAIEIDVMYDLVDNNGMVIPPTPPEHPEIQYSSFPVVRLIDFREGLALSSSWTVSTSKPEAFVCPILISPKEESAIVKAVLPDYNVHTPLYVSHVLNRDGIDSILPGCQFSFPDGSVTYFYSLGKALAHEPVMIYSIPPVSLTTQNLSGPITTFEIPYRTKKPNHNTYNTWEFRRWSLPKELNCVFEQPANATYFRIGDSTYSKKSADWWWLAGGGFFPEGKYNNYSTLNNLGNVNLQGTIYKETSFTVSANEFVITLFVGNGYSWCKEDEACRRTWMPGITCYFHDQYGNRYKLDVGCWCSNGSGQDIALSIDWSDRL